MTIHLPKSALAKLGYDFDAEVAKHIKALEDHRISGDAAPHSYPEVEAAVRRVQYPVDEKKPDDFVADYVIDDDTPPPPTLAERKAIARAELLKEEQDEINKLIAPEKARYAQMVYDRARMADPKTPADKKTIADYEAMLKAVSDIRFAYAAREAAIADMI